jgi:hypothetical protein
MALLQYYSSNPTLSISDTFFFLLQLHGAQDDVTASDLEPSVESCLLQGDGVRLQQGENPLEPSTSMLYLGPEGFLRYCTLGGNLQFLTKAQYDQCYDTIANECLAKGATIGVTRLFNICEKEQDDNGYTLQTYDDPGDLRDARTNGGLFSGEDVPGLPNLIINDACKVEGDIAADCPCLMGNGAEQEFVRRFCEHVPQ